MSDSQYCSPVISAFRNAFGSEATFYLFIVAALITQAQEREDYALAKFWWDEARWLFRDPQNWAKETL